MQWGDLATWVGAIGTTGAFGVSLFLLWQSLEDRRKGQARLVAAWQHGISVEGGSVNGVEYHASITYHVSNNSQEPVYNVVMGAMCGVRGSFVRHLGVLGPLEKREVTILLVGSPRAEQYAPSLAFVDADGRQWLRDGRGQLRTSTAVHVSEEIREDAGAYSSLAEHPTLHLHPPGEPDGGKPIN